MNSVTLLEDLDRITNDNLNFVNRKVKTLTENQLNWSPNEFTWSVNQILAHLNSYAHFYHEAIQSRIEVTKFNSPKEIFQSSPLGKSGWLSMKLGNAKNVKRKFNAPKKYDPLFTPELMEGNQISIFVERQNEMKELLLKSALVNLKKVKIPISISKLIKFRLGDALMYVIYHNERHIQQARNLIAHRSFPKK